MKNEDHCLPCLHGCDKNATSLKQDADDMCMICFTEALSAAPAIQVGGRLVIETSFERGPCMFLKSVVFFYRGINFVLWFGGNMDEM